MSYYLKFFESLISGMLPFVLLMLVGGFLTVKSKGFQFRNLGKSVKVFFTPDKGKGKNLTAFQSACNSLAATVGTGNIVGVGAAVVLGGAGAVFWMWVSAAVAMCIKSAEIMLAIYFKEKQKDKYVGGPMYYIKNGMPKKYEFLGVIYAFTGVFSCFLSGNIIQTNSAVLCFSSDTKIRLILGMVFSIITAVVIVGGVTKISAFTTKAVPFMSVLYIVLCLGVIIANFSSLPKCFTDIFKGAFCPSAVTGGVLGSVSNTVISGATKGVFSNESGLGTAAIAYSAGESNDIYRQGLYGIFEVFLDTLVLCTLSALTILSSGVIIDYGNEKTVPVVNAFSSVYGSYSKLILGIMLSVFAVSSIIGWAVYGISFSKFLIGAKGEKIFTRVYPFFCILGAVLNVKTVWRAAEFFNGIMIIVNMFAIILLKEKVIFYLKDTEYDKTN